MIAHTSLPVSNYRTSKAFYSQVLSTLGYKNNMEDGKSAGFNDGKNTDFWITQEKNVVATCLGFRARGRNQVEAFYEPALAAECKDISGPRYRSYTRGSYAAFVLDAEGNNIEA